MCAWSACAKHLRPLAAAQRKAKEVARSKGRTVSALTLEYAAYIFVATNIPETVASDVQVLETYRLR